MYKYNLAIFCKTCVRDIENLKLLLSSIKQFNKDNIPVCVSISKKEKDILEPLFISYDMNIEVFYDEDLLKDYTQKSFDNKFYNYWIPQQIVKLNLYTTNFAEHYVIIDSDCYFIKEFCINDFISEKNIPYISVADAEKGEKLLVGLVYYAFYKENNVINRVEKIQEFFCRKGPKIYIDMPFVYTSEYMKHFIQYLQEKNITVEELIKICPFEMQWYLEFLIYSQLQFIPCGAYFVPIHIETQYQILRWLGFDEQIFKKNYIGICMNKGHVKSIKFKPLWFGKNIIRHILKWHYCFTKERDDYKVDEKKTILQRIFSVTNEYKNNIKRKVIIILGIKFKIKTIKKGNLYE